MFIFLISLVYAVVYAGTLITTVNKLFTLCTLCTFYCYNYFCTENQWQKESKVDRAFIWPKKVEEVEGLILWQNSKECHKCSWIRTRDIDGNIILPFNKQLIAPALIDTRWKQRFRFSLENENKTDFDDDGKGKSEFYQFQEGSNYTLEFMHGKNVSISRISGNDNKYSPIWGSFLLLFGIQIIYSSLFYFIRQKGIKIEKKSKFKKERLKSLDTFRG